MGALRIGRPLVGGEKHEDRSMNLIQTLEAEAIEEFKSKKSIPDFVSRALAGLCLVDLLAFAGIAATIRTDWNALDASPLYLALIPLSCFLFSLLLQRLAPAT